MKFIKYAEHVQAPQYVIDWVGKNIKKEVPTDEGEHIIDYLVSKEAPSRLNCANYEDTKNAADKWLKAQIKKGNNIKETKKDTEVVLDFKDGFKIVKLVGENAYKREGFLMSHCVAGYYGKDVEVYSLRDKDNMPHCTMEKNQQVKGKGNKDIHPKYIDYVIQFLESINMTVGDDEMKNLGYVNIEKLLPNLHKDTESLLYKGKYFPIEKGHAVLKDKKGNQYLGLDLLDCFPLLVEEKTENSWKFKLNFDMSVLFEYSKKTIIKCKDVIEDLKDSAKMSGGNSAQMSGGDFAKMSGGDYAQMSGGNSAQMSGGNYAKMSGGYSAKMSGGNSAQMSGGDSAKMSGGDSAQMSGGDSAQMSGGNYAQMSGGDSAQMSGGYSAQMSGGYSAKMSGGDYAQMVSGYNSTLEILQHGIAVGDNQSQAKGKVGSLLVLVNREQKNGELIIVDYKASLVDGEIIKEDTWYKLEKGEFVEVKD